MFQMVPNKDTFRVEYTQRVGREREYGWIRFLVSNLFRDQDHIDSVFQVQILYFSPLKGGDSVGNNSCFYSLIP